MFLKFYGLREQPFGVTPDPRFLYMSETHREGLASLFYGIKTGRGFLALVAKPGMGKTSLLFRLMQNLEGTARTVFLFQTQCDSREFFRYLLTDMGIPAQGQDLVQMHTQLNEALIENAKSGKQFVVIIDEAQNFDNNVLETVRLLSDFETPQAKLMQIVLAGQPQLAGKLAHPSLTQLSQRISTLSRLAPFTSKETAQYVEHRLLVAGHASNAKLFSPAALDLIAKQSQGIPRNINNLCFNALSWGFAMKKPRVDVEIVREVAAELAVNAASDIAQEVPVEAPVTKPVIKPTSEPQPIRVAPLSPPEPEERTAISRWARPVAALAALLAAALFFSLNYSRSWWSFTLHPAPRVPALPIAVPDRVAAAAGNAGARGFARRGALSGTQATTNANGVEDLTVVVGPQDTLWLISQRYLGQAGPQTLKDIAQLNPELKDPNHIEVGQRIRLRRGTNASDDQSGAQQNPESAVGAGRDRP